MNCPSCHRPVAMARPRCLYCGAALPAATVEAAQAAAAEAPETPAKSDRVLLIVDMTGADARATARALGLSTFEAAQRVRRGGPQVVRIVDAAAASQEADRIAKEGMRVERVAEAEALQAARPVLAAGGRRDDAGLDLMLPGGRLRLEPADVVLVVKGPITREYQTRDLKKVFEIAVPDRGYRFHLHRPGDPRPVELDPGAFEFPTVAAPQSSLLVLTEWIEAVARDAPKDDAFRLAPPALAPQQEEEGGGLKAAAALRRKTAGKKDEGRVVLDNLAQFRFYSAWRGILERQRKGTP